MNTYTKSAKAITAYDFFYNDIYFNICEEYPDMCQTELDKEIERRWNECRLTDTEKFKHYVTMSCEQLLRDNEAESAKPSISRLVSSLKPSPSRSHEGPCFPDERTCQNCWSYWCGKCGSGMASWIGGCCYSK